MTNDGFKSFLECLCGAREMEAVRLESEAKVLLRCGYEIDELEILADRCTGRMEIVPKSITGVS